MNTIDNIRASQGAACTLHELADLLIVRNYSDSAIGYRIEVAEDMLSDLQRTGVISSTAAGLFRHILNEFERGVYADDETS